MSRHDRYNRAMQVQVIHGSSPSPTALCRRPCLSESPQSKEYLTAQRFSSRLFHVRHSERAQLSVGCLTHCSLLATWLMSMSWLHTCHRLQPTLHKGPAAVGAQLLHCGHDSMWLVWRTASSRATKGRLSVAERLRCPRFGATLTLIGSSTRFQPPRSQHDTDLKIQHDTAAPRALTTGSSIQHTAAQNERVSASLRAALHHRRQKEPSQPQSSLLDECYSLRPPADRGASPVSHNVPLAAMHEQVCKPRFSLSSTM